MKLCCSKIMRVMSSEWDEQLPDEQSKEWRKRVNALQRLEQIAIPRKRVPDNKNVCDYEFHVFSDSKKDIAAAALYFRSFNNHNCSANLVAAKTSIFSRHEMAQGSIPHKELIALVIGSRLLSECMNATSLTITRYGLIRKLFKNGVRQTHLNCAYSNETE